MVTTRSTSSRLLLAAIGSVAFVAIVWAARPASTPAIERSALSRRRFTTLFATARPVTDYSLLVRNPNRGTRSRILVRVRVCNGDTMTRTLEPGESVDTRSLLPESGAASERVISDVSVMEQRLADSQVEWWLAP